MAQWTLYREGNTLNPGPQGQQLPVVLFRFRLTHQSCPILADNHEHRITDDALHQSHVGGPEPMEATAKYNQTVPKTLIDFFTISLIWIRHIITADIVLKNHLEHCTLTHKHLTLLFTGYSGECVTNSEGINFY